MPQSGQQPITHPKTLFDSSTADVVTILSIPKNSVQKVIRSEERQIP